MSDKLYLYSHSTTYNFRPGELYGMGKESLTVTATIPKTLEEIFEELTRWSSIKHDSIKEAFYGMDLVVEREDWKKWLGQPMYYITDIKVWPAEEENVIPQN